MVQYSLNDVYEKRTYQVRMDVFSNGIQIGIEGLGEKYLVNGYPIMIEIRHGIPFVLIWDDITSDEPHEVSMERAREEYREE